MAMTEEDVRTLKAKVLARMERDRQRMLLKLPFAGAVAMRLDLVPVHDCRLRTCATDYRRIYADIEFYAGLSDKESLHVFAHEVWHAALLHDLRRQGRDERRFNIAADIEIYFLLCDEGLAIPSPIPIKGEWRSLNAEQIYERLAADPNYAPNASAERPSRNGGSATPEPPADGCRRLRGLA